VIRNWSLITVTYDRLLPTEKELNLGIHAHVQGVISRIMCNNRPRYGSSKRQCGMDGTAASGRRRWGP
jgi:hypothetical protein